MEKTWGIFFHLDNCKMLLRSRLYSILSTNHSPGTSGVVHIQIFRSELSSSLDWKDHIDLTVKKKKWCFGFSEKKCPHNSRETKLSAYARLVCPHLEYCAVLTWNIVLSSPGILCCPHLEYCACNWVLIQTKQSRKWGWFKEDKLSIAFIDTSHRYAP